MDREAVLELRDVHDEVVNIGEAAIIIKGNAGNADIHALCDLIGRLSSQVRTVAWHVEQLVSKEDPKPI